MSGDAFQISETNSLYPAVAYNATSNQFLITWDDAGAAAESFSGSVQRLEWRAGGSELRDWLALRGHPVGSGVESAQQLLPGGILGARSDRYLRSARVRRRRLARRQLQYLQRCDILRLSSNCLGAASNHFLVTWDNEDGNIHARRVNGQTGSMVGSTIHVTTGGAKDRSCVAYDSVNHRWLVQFNDNANPGYSYDQFGQFVNPYGTLDGSPFPIAHTAAFEGDTQFGGDIAFAPLAQRFFSSFGTDTGMGGQESFANGAPAGAQVVLGTGYYTSLNNAADPSRNRSLTAWEGLVNGTWLIFGQLSAATINPVTNFHIVSQNSQNVLFWRTPNDTHFTGTMIRMRTNGYPTGPEDGVLVADRGIPVGQNDSFTHGNLTNWTTYYYAAYAHDIGPNYSLAAYAAATPRPAGSTFSSSDFSAGADGWALETWRAGRLAFGTIGWDAEGNILSTGSGASNNRDTCTREGSTMTQTISTAGRQSIQVEYDVMATLNGPPSGSLGGTCAVLEGSEEDKLVVFYSVNGTNGPWNVAQVLNEAVELPTPWTRELINLAGLPSINNNPNFTLRFQWQFNSANDTGRVDNVRLLSEAVTGPDQAIKLTPAQTRAHHSSGPELRRRRFPREQLRRRHADFHCQRQCSVAQHKSYYRQQCGSRAAYVSYLQHSRAGHRRLRRAHSSHFP